MIIVITGASGFIGSHFVQHFLSLNHTVIAIDSFKHKGTWSRLIEAIGTHKKNLQVFYHDLNSPIDEVLFNRISDVIGDNDSIFINCASNSAVNRSISNPRECWENNTAIAINTLEYLKKANYTKIIHLSTDEVYGNYEVSSGNGYKEWSSINPSNPYSASKAAQEALYIAYWRTYNLPIAIVNTMNNIGEWQDNEKFIPLIISRIKKNKIINVYAEEGKTSGSRVYLDVKDHAHMMSHICKTKIPMFPGNDMPFRVNLCGKEEVSNLEMVLLIGNLMGKSREEIMPLIRLVSPDVARPGYDKRYLLDSTKSDELFKFSHTPLATTLNRIIQFNTKNPEWME